MANDPYPVFKGGTAEQQRSSGGGGGGGGSGWGIGKGVLVGVAAMLAIGFSAVAISTCREDAGNAAEHEAAEAAQRQARERDKACRADPECVLYMPEAPRAAAPTEKCDAGAAAREAAARETWVRASDPTDPDGFSPYAKGFRAVGLCNTKIANKMFDCSAATVRNILGENPILRRALELGFVAYVCEKVGSEERTEYPLARIVGAR